MRQCGQCSLCCKLLPVKSLHKGAGERCRHQRAFKGCAVYAKLGAVSPECKLWVCRWLIGDAGSTSRPDRAGYVIDTMPDYVTITGPDSLEYVPVVQIWIDPARPDAHRDPALRAWLNDNRACALVRYDDRRALFVAPPSINADGTWFEHAKSRLGEPHSPEDVFATVGNPIAAITIEESAT